MCEYSIVFEDKVGPVQIVGCFLGRSIVEIVVNGAEEPGQKMLFEISNEGLGREFVSGS